MGQRREVGGNGANQYKSNGATVSPLQKTTADIASEAGVSKRIFDMWQACWTNEEIADKENIDKATVSRLLQNGNFADLQQTPTALHQTDFTPPIYNVWKQQNSTYRKMV